MATLTPAGALASPPPILRTPGVSEAASAAMGEWHGDPEWVRALRARGWEAWETIPMPTLTTEGWRRSDLRWLNLDAVIPACEAPARRVETLEELPAELLEQLQTNFEEGALLIQQDGVTVFGAIRDSLREQGLIVTDIHTALREHHELLGKYFMQLLPPRWRPGMPSNAGKFEALNAALFNGGAFVYVPPDTTVTLPLRFISWAATPSTAFFPRSLVIVDRGSRLVYLDEYRSTSAPAGAPLVFGSGAVEAYVEDGARLDYVSAQEWSLTTGGYLTARTGLGSDAYVNWVLVNLGGQYSRVTADVLLQGKGTRAELLGLAFGEKTQVFDVHTLQDHLSPFTDSDQSYRTALRHRSRVAYEGLINIRQGSYGSNGYQANKNLLLDDTAKADSIPMLEINDNDVRCTHSSASGPVEEEHIYYLMSRGLSRPHAERTLVQGHFEPVIARIGVEELRERIRGVVDRKIGEEIGD
ncbi:MAG TPA: Fe-S cluster assembly protein SufD [Chloroflexota bacterium]|nr:Fe-S cluster assembly protein SufD [Chloroflexota bacterium]